MPLFAVASAGDFIYIHDNDNRPSRPFPIMTIDMISLAIGLAAIALVFAYTLLTGSPPTPTSPRVRRAMLRLLPRRLDAAAGAGTIYELGAGWGGNALALAGSFPDHAVVAIERSPLPWLVARLRAAVSGHRNLSVRRGDFMKRDFSDAVLAVCYLSGRQMPGVAGKLRRELAPGALVLTHTFALPGWQPVDTVQADDLYKSPVYLYEAAASSAARGAVAPASQAATSSGS